MLQRLHDAIVTDFFPAVFDGEISDLEASLFFLPARMGGLGICSPVDLCDIDFTSSHDGTVIVSDAVRGCARFD